MPTLVRAVAADADLRSPRPVYTNGMMVGVDHRRRATIPLVLPLVGGSWRADLVVWSVPVLFAALLFVGAGAGARPPSANATRRSAGGRTGKARSSGCSASRSASTTRSSSPPTPSCRIISPATGRGELIGPTIGWLNGAQLIASVAADRDGGNHAAPQAGPSRCSARSPLLGVIGIVLGDGLWIVLSAAVLGFAASVTFVVSFGLPAIVSPPGEVHRIAGGMFTISYTIAVITPIICGALWDWTGVPWTAFMPIGSVRAAADRLRRQPERAAGMNSKTSMSDATVAKLLLVALAFCWGLSWTAMRVALDEVSPWAMRLIGYSIGSATLLVLLKAQGRSLVIPRGKDRLHVVVAALILAVGFGVAGSFAQLMANTSRVIIVNYSMPVWGSLMAYVVLRERINMRSGARPRAVRRGPRACWSIRSRRHRCASRSGCCSRSAARCAGAPAPST